jgi:hypothetical protein
VAALKSCAMEDNHGRHSWRLDGAADRVRQREVPGGADGGDPRAGRQYRDKLYLEFGGKLLFDYHAARVLPGFDPNVKMRLLQGLSDRAEVVLCIYAGDIERKKMRADFGITYDTDALKLIDDVREWGVAVQDGGDHPLRGPAGRQGVQKPPRASGACVSIPIARRAATPPTWT